MDKESGVTTEIKGFGDEGSEESENREEVLVEFTKEETLRE